MSDLGHAGCGHAAFGGALTACSVSMSTGVSKSDVEANALTTLQSCLPDLQIENVTCSDGLDAKAGATTTCEVLGTTGHLTVFATVSDVTDGEVNWTFSESQQAE